MKLRVLCVGKVKEPRLEGLCSEYLTRLRRHSPAEVEELRDGTAREPEKRLADEAARLRPKLDNPMDTVLLDENGQSWSSEELARRIEERRLHGCRRLTFVIGSSHGIDPAFKREIPLHLQLSRFTLTHEMARMLLLEQLYRSHCILAGIPYHH